eukprot:6172952-Pleurochrysis_carterae.AAC.3
MQDPAFTYPRRQQTTDKVRDDFVIKLQPKAHQSISDALAIPGGGGRPSTWFARIFSSSACGCAFSGVTEEPRSSDIRNLASDANTSTLKMLQSCRSFKCWQRSGCVRSVRAWRHTTARPRAERRAFYDTDNRERIALAVMASVPKFSAPTPPGPSSTHAATDRHLSVELD